MSITELLQALVRIPSPNPPGDTRAIALYIARTLAAAGCAVRTVAPPDKPEAVNVIASIGQGDPVILLHAHIDTVPIGPTEADRWTVDPYAGVIRDGKLYGKGSVDDKAPLAAMMTALMEAAARAQDIRGTLVLAAAAEEEVGGALGTRWLSENGHLPMSDFIVVGEQTGNQIGVANKGVMRATIQTTGRSVHATNPDRGVNAITAMAKIVLALEQYHHELAARAHPLVGAPTCNVGVIEGGSTANAVPDRCTIRIDRRMVPREDPAAVQDELRAVVAAASTPEAPASVGDFLYSHWFESGIASPLAQTFLACAGAVLPGGAAAVGYAPGSDAKHLMTLRRGEMIIFGPGSYEVAHAADEYVTVDDLAATTEILRRFVTAALFG